MMSHIKLQLVGEFELLSPAGLCLKIPSKKARVLLAYLASRVDFSASRLDVAHLLWEHHEEQQALTNLRQLLAVLNGLIASESSNWLIKQNGFLALNDDVWRIDINRIENGQIETEQELGSTLELFRGKFLEGLSFHEAGLSDWLDQLRRQCDFRQIELCGRLLTLFINAKKFDSACHYAETLVRLDPIDELNHQRLMSIYAELGQRHRILRQYQQCCQALEQHQMGEPQEHTTRLFQSLYYKTRVKPVFEEVKSIVLSADASFEVQKAIPAIAVLPFRELLARPEAITLGSALTGEIVNELRRFHGIKVISALSSMSLQGQNCDLKTAAGLLGARYLVGGSIQQSKLQVQINVELADAETGELIWADRYSRRIEELFVFQSELARDIAGAIEPEAVGHAYLMSTRKPPESMSAWDMVLRGDHHLFKQIGTRWNSDHAQKFYNKAIELDPDYAPSYTGLAYSLCLELKEDIAADAKRVEKQMLEMAEHAVRLDSSNPWCLVVLARAQQQFIGRQR